MLEELKKALQSTNLKIDLDKLDADKNLFDQGVDSFDHIMIIFAIEEYFNVKISDEDLNSGKMSTLNNILRFIESAEANFHE